MTTTLVTGGNGFIGRCVVDELLAQKRDVVVFDRARRHPETDVMFADMRESIFLGDIRDATAVTEAMAHVDSWIHLAGVLGTQETIGNPRPAAETNIMGGLNVLEAAAQYKLPGVNIAVGNWWETNTYSITKSTMERFCTMYRMYRGLPVTVVRALNAYGPGQLPAAPYGPSKVRKIMPSFIMRALTGKPIEVYGNGDQIMDMIHARDVARVLVAALELTEERGGQTQVFEAGTGRETSVLTIAQTVARTVGGNVAVKHLDLRPGETPNARVLGDPMTLLPLGITSEMMMSLENGVAETVAHYRKRWMP